jgi:hypothetical protein
VDLSFVELPSYKIEGIEFQNQHVAALDIAPLLEKWGYEGVGILGYDFLSRFVTRIDYANERISFYEPGEFEYDGDGVVVDAPLSGNIFSLPITVDGKHSGTWAVDIGAGGESFHYPYATNEGLLNTPAIETLAGGAGGSFIIKTARFDTLEIAGFIVKNPIIDIPVQKGKGGFSSTEIAGNLGNTVLDKFIVYFDYENQKMIFEKGELFDSPIKFNRIGFQMELSEQKDILVSYTIPNSPAAKKGVQKGDKLVSINGIGVDKFKNIFVINDLFTEKTGTKFIIEFERQGRIRGVKLKLKDLL